MSHIQPKGASALCVAAEKGYAKIVKLLLEKNAAELKACRHTEAFKGLHTHTEKVYTEVAKCERPSMLIEETIAIVCEFYLHFDSFSHKALHMQRHSMTCHTVTD